MQWLIAAGFTALGILFIGAYVFKQDKEHGFQFIEEGILGIGIVSLVIGLALIFYPPEVF